MPAQSRQALEREIIYYALRRDQHRRQQHQNRARAHSRARSSLST